MRSKLFFVTALFFVTVCTWVSCMNNDDSNDPALPDVVSYNFHIRPILSDKCFKCHGPDVSKQQAGLRLDYAKFAYAPLTKMKGAFAIVPGKPDESELYKRISSTDSSYMMPDPEAHLGALTPYQIKLFRKWIE